MSRLAVGMSWHGNRDKLRNLLRKEVKETKVRDRAGRLVLKRNGEPKIRRKPIYKSGVYIISNSYNKPQYKVGMGGQVYKRLMSGYNLCFSDLKSFRIHYFVEVPGDADRRKAFETIILSRLRRDPRNENVIMTNFKSLEWVSKHSKAELRRQLISVLNQHADWKQLYSFSERGYKCVPQSVRGVTRRVSPIDLRPQIGEESECKDDEERIVREKVFEMLEKADLERKERAKQKKIQSMLNKARELKRNTRLQDQSFMDPLAEAVRRSVTDADRNTRDARARRRQGRRQSR